MLFLVMLVVFMGGSYHFCMLFRKVGIFLLSVRLERELGGLEGELGGCSRDFVWLVGCWRELGWCWREFFWIGCVVGWLLEGVCGTGWVLEGVFCIGCVAGCVLEGVCVLVCVLGLSFCCCCGHRLYCVASVKVTFKCSLRCDFQFSKIFVDAHTNY